MSKRIAIKNHHYEIQLMTYRVFIAFAIMGCLVFLLSIRLAYLQIYKHPLYTTLSIKNWLDLRPIEPTRGLIYDRNGLLIAENTPVFSLDVIPIQVQNLAQSLAQLKNIIHLNDTDISQFLKQMKQHRRFEEIPLKLRLTEDEVARFSENQYLFPGILIKARLMRYYPYGQNFSHVLGYIGRINAHELNEIDPINYSASHYIGKIGIEKYYETVLHGKVGYQQVENDASGKPIRILKEIKSIPGHNIYLTLDSKLQFAAEKAMSGREGAIVAIDPATGQVLAMVSKPDFDPNRFVQGISQKDYQTLQSSQDKPLYHRALSGLYPLASTIKPYLALMALDMGITKEDDMIDDPGWFQLPNNEHRFHDHRRYGHDRVNLSKAIMSSCDTYFYSLSIKMGIQRMDTILSQFGFGQKTGIDLNDELPGIIASPAWKQKVKGSRWYDGDTVISSIGQGYMQATPLQLAEATATLANHGKRFTPYLLLGEQAPNQVYRLNEPVALQRVTLKNNQYWDVVIKAMQAVVASPQGTAYQGFGRNYAYTIAAKTGTGQVSKRRNPNEGDKQDNLPVKLRDHNLFVAFAPVNNPKIALAIVTEHSHTAVPIARVIFDYYLGEINQVHVNRTTQAKIKKTIE